VASTGEEKSKSSTFWEGYLDIALEGGLPFAMIGTIIGAIAGAFLGWTLVPPETINLIQAALAVVGLALGAILGFIAGLLLINIFWVAVLIAIVYYIGRWLLGS